MRQVVLASTATGQQAAACPSNTASGSDLCVYGWKQTFPASTHKLWNKTDLFNQSKHFRNERVWIVDVFGQTCSIRVSI